MYFCHDKLMFWQTYSTGIIKIELTIVEIQEQTASFQQYWISLKNHDIW